jgi:hypothetical protein
MTEENFQVPFSIAHLEASLKLTSLSTSLSTLFPTKTTIRSGEPKVRASVNHKLSPWNDDRLKKVNSCQYSSPAED